MRHTQKETQRTLCNDGTLLFKHPPQIKMHQPWRQEKSQPSSELDPNFSRGLTRGLAVDVADGFRAFAKEPSAEEREVAAVADALPTRMAKSLEDLWKDCRGLSLSASASACEITSRQGLERTLFKLLPLNGGGSFEKQTTMTVKLSVALFSSALRTCAIPPAGLNISPFDTLLPKTRLNM